LPKEARWTPNADYTGMRQMCDNANPWLYRAWTDKKRKFKIEPAYTTYFSDKSLLLEYDDYYI